MIKDGPRRTGLMSARFADGGEQPKQVCQGRLGGRNARLTNMRLQQLHMVCMIYSGIDHGWWGSILNHPANCTFELIFWRVA
jgi:hypothetical protein